MAVLRNRESDVTTTENRRADRSARNPNPALQLIGGPRPEPLRRRRGLPPAGGRRSLFGDSGFAQAINDALPSGDRSRIVARRTGANSGDGESRVHRQSRPNLGPRFKEPPDKGQGGGQKEMRHWEISIGFDRP